MRGSIRYTQMDGWDEVYAWADDLPMEVEELVSSRVSLDDRQAAKAEHARGMLDRWDSRLKLAERKVTLAKRYQKKWRLSVRRYDGLMAAKAALTACQE
jgi:hypothetical protein